MVRPLDQEPKTTVGNAPNGVPRIGSSSGRIGIAHDDMKLRGGYYTPAAIAKVLTEWAITDTTKSVLEPSAGDGQFVIPADARMRGRGNVTAVELYEEEAERIRPRVGDHTTVYAGDFFQWLLTQDNPGTFDAVLGNPPFIRYQHFPEEQRGPAFALMVSEGLKPTRLTNAWLPFVVAATVALREGGRLAMVVPAELLQVGYAGELRAYLARTYSHLTVVTFRELVFDGILQETILLLGIRQNDAQANIAFVELDKLQDLSLGRVLDPPEVEVDLNHAREKWTQYYLSPTELALIRELEGSGELGRLGEVADVDVGVVTGRNEFFVMAPSDARKWGVAGSCLRLVGRSAQIPGLVLRPEELAQLELADSRCYLLQLGKVGRDRLTEEARAYVEWGERQEYHTGYKCRIRLPTWWNVPSVWAPDAFLLRQIYDGPRIIVNRAGATSTDTIHRVKARNGANPAWIAAASMNSLTWAFSEIRGRSYGGGVLELEPTEAEGLPFPRPYVSRVSVDDLDVLVRSRGPEAAMDEVDQDLRRESGISAGDLRTLREVWRKLYGRRMSRKKR